MSEEATKAKPPAAAMKEQLEAIQEALASLVEHQDKQTSLGTLLDECRTTIIEAVGVMHSQGSDILAQLDILAQRQASPTPPSRFRVRAWLVWLGGGVAGALVMGSVWFCWPAGAHRDLAVALDSALVQVYGQLSKPVQETITAVYRQTGFQSPAARQKGNK